MQKRATIRIFLFSMFVLTAGCGRTQYAGEWDANQRDGGLDVEVTDSRPDRPGDATPTCISGQLRCQGDRLQICLNGSFADQKDCSYGCTQQPSPHCGTPVWSNQVTNDDMEAGLEDAVLFPGEVVLDTDTGLFTGPGAPSAVPFRVVDRSSMGLPDLIILPFLSLRVRSGCIVSFVGSRIPVIVAKGDISIEGILDLSAGHNGRPGPGGYPGGIDGAPGSGPGAGSAGLLGPLRVQEGGGGGAGFGGLGGAGGNTATAPGGAAGRAYGNPQLDPIVGGSGGGSGAKGDSSNPGGGGAGGGAIALMSLTRVQVLTDGMILAGGGGGLGGGWDDAGGGGGSGGAILLAAPEVRILGVLAANGGAGGGSDTTPPQDGATGDGSDQPAQPGSGGGAGGAGTTPDAVSADEASLHGSGGGGGCGRIRIESRDEPILGGLISPSPQTPLTTLVPLPVE